MGHYGVVPVPPKAVVYPEALVASSSEVAAARLDGQFVRLVEVLRASGVEVLDLVPALMAQKDDSLPPLYCRQDTHWSARTCELVAALLGERLRDLSWITDLPHNSYAREQRTIVIEGDLLKRLEVGEIELETLPLKLVHVADDPAKLPVPPWRESPVLLLGDSHPLVFHAGGDLLASGAGLADQLAYELGFAVDVVGVRGSDSTAARMTLFRRGDELAGKRIVIWVFAARELTESADGWRRIPVIRNGR